VSVARAGAVLVLASACSSFDPQAGPPQQQTPPLCVDADSDPARDVVFARQIRPLMDWRLDNPRGPGCSECHYPTGDIHEGIEVGELDLSTLGALRKGGVTSGGDIVVPGQPCESALVRKLLGNYEPAPTRMPRSARRYWTAKETQLVIDWIAEGANGSDDE
jgi:hypothetical protein